jgi:two-component system response regulator (stage 0 sporulation protein F)
MAKLLIIDDEADVREFAANFFRKRKIDAITSCSGEEALKVLEKQIPDLILLDIKMPGIDGIETLRRIKDSHKDAKVIMVTGRRPDEDGAYAACRRLGALAYVHKPLELDELEKVVIKHLHSNL